MSLEPYTRGAVSRYYSVLLNINSPSSDNYREQWQEELEVEISSNACQKCIENIYHSSINARHNLI